jgi:hypothetical protein
MSVGQNESLGKLRENPIMKNLSSGEWMERKSYLWRTLIRPSVSQEKKLTKEIQAKIKDRFESIGRVVVEKGVPAALDQATRNLYDDSVLDPLFSMYKTVGVFYARMMFRKAVTDATDLMKGLSIRTQIKAVNSFGQIWENALVEYLRLHGIKFVSDISNTTREEIIRILQSAITEGWSETRIIDSLLNSRMHRARAERIARTETTRAINAGILLAAAAVPYEVRKEWITAEDERVRGRPFSHVALHGRSIPIELSFNNGENIRFPGDPNASASNVINCRCVLNIIPTRDRFGRPIPRQVNALDSDILNRLTNLL